MKQKQVDKKQNTLKSIKISHQSSEPQLKPIRSDQVLHLARNEQNAKKLRCLKPMIKSVRKFIQIQNNRNWIKRGFLSSCKIIIVLLQELMIDPELVIGHRQKHYKSQFIYKLVDIMKNFPELVSWAQNGNSIQFFNIQLIQKNILPSYFRHSNFSSFLRQLHLYNFKQKKQLKNPLVFEHAVFKQGNQKEFIHIQRIRNKKAKQGLLKELENNDILKRITDSNTLSSQQKQVLVMMFSYKLIVLEKQKNLRQKLESLNATIRLMRSAKINEVSTGFQQEIKIELESLKKFSKSIDIFLTQTLDEYKKGEEPQVKKQKKEEGEESKKQQQKPQLGSIKRLSNGDMINSMQSGYEHSRRNMMGSNILSQQNSQSSFFNYKFFLINPGHETEINLPSQMNPHYTNHPEQYYVEMKQNLTRNILSNQREPSIIFMPLPFYNKSVASEYFESTIRQSNNYPRHDENIEEKQGEASVISKSMQFLGADQTIQKKGVKIRKELNDIHSEEDSEISFLNQFGAQERERGAAEDKGKFKY